MQAKMDAPDVLSDAEVLITEKTMARDGYVRFSPPPSMGASHAPILRFRSR
jgi:hypothetical protein